MQHTFANPTQIVNGQTWNHSTLTNRSLPSNYHTHYTMNPNRHNNLSIATQLQQSTEFQRERVYFAQRTNPITSSVTSVVPQYTSNTIGVTHVSSHDSQRTVYKQPQTEWSQSIIPTRNHDYNPEFQSADEKQKIRKAFEQRSFGLSQSKNEYALDERQTQETQMEAEQSPQHLSLQHSPGLLGIFNIGNSCYMSAALQCLFNIPQLINYFIGNQFFIDLNMSSPSCGRLAKELRELICQYRGAQSTPQPLHPKQLMQEIVKVEPRFTGFRQQDAHEFLCFLLDGLEKDLNRSSQRPPASEIDMDRLSDGEKAQMRWRDYRASHNCVITDLLCGLMKSTVRCHACKYLSTCFDPYQDLSLSIPNDASGNAQSSLLDCLDLHLKEELMTTIDGFKCSKCKRSTKATKQLTIWSLPDVLVIHLKRFSQSSHRFQKITHKVDVPVHKLDMSPFLDANAPHDRRSYQLAGAIMHMGSLSYGHYSAICRNPDTNKWFSYDDQ
eukprot:TRINITY_DN4494_c0_g2_i4.p1 TRINITY_DN4494_c0_g2~~TRINITY_DN4494_c0_g2_i4.p1  ORF type:complete len:497 (-),score=99.93 TRINITY_DN4494_c0_g2_i4:136-1626(-)